MITIDSLRADHLGCYGYGPPTSPRLDAFAKQSTLFRHAYATAPWTLPSHVSIFTGLDASSHGVDTDKAVLTERANTMAEVFLKAGYHTSAVICAPLLRRRYGLTQGFQEFNTSLMGRSYAEARQVKVADEVTKLGLSYIDLRRDKPFFMWLHYWDPHYDYNPAQKYIDLFDPGYQGKQNGLDIQNRTDITSDIDPRDLRHLIALYDGEIRFTDDALGALFDGLQKRGLLDNTLIVVTADHGEEFLDHGGTGHTWTCYEELMHVPLIIYSPGLRTVAPQFDQQVSIIDIFPTVLSLVGLKYDGQAVQGRSLVEMMTTGKPLEPRHLLMETRAARLQPGGKIGRWSALLAPSRLKLHRYYRANEDTTFLFDLNSDPHERQDLAPARGTQLEDLTRMLSQMRRRDRDLNNRLAINGDEQLDQEQTEMLRGLGYLQ